MIGFLLEQRNATYRMGQNMGAALHFPEYLENYQRQLYDFFCKRQGQCIPNMSIINRKFNNAVLYSGAIWRKLNDNNKFNQQRSITTS